jgi:uncharacterized membrane protein
MKELKSFLERMGGLHDDVVIRQLIWTPESEGEELLGSTKCFEIAVNQRLS